MTGHELQYIASTNGSFDCVLAANVSHNSVIEEKFLATSYVQDAVYFGENYADIRFSNENKLMYWYAGGNIDVTSLYTYNVEHVVSFSTYEYYFDGVKVYDVTGVCNIPSQPRFRSNVKGYLCYFKITDNNVDRVNLVAWEDGNGTLGLYDKVNDVFYTPASGTWTAGPLAHTFESDKSSLRFEASGGTGTLEITAETGWTCTTPTAFTMSTTTGTTGTTTITVTAPANTGSTKIEEIITFTDADNYTFDVKLRQKVDGAGFSYLQIGADTIDTFYIGDLQIEALYFGEEQIYGSGPFVGLKVTKELNFNPNQLTGTLTIKSSENWSLSDNSGGGSYYTLDNYTTGCNGWVPTYDGSLNGGELGEYGLWFEWEYGVSDKSFQEWVDGLAAYGITATGSYCPGARYSLYLNPHATGGPGWLSYSQTTGGTGETIVTVTASTAQAARTATITVTSANYSATISVTQVVGLPNKTFWVNYNAKKYNSTTLTLPKENGQLFNEDLVLPGAVTFNNDYITITGDKRIHFAFNNTSDNIFNRTTNTASITIIAKTSNGRSTWFVSNRSNVVGWMVSYSNKNQMAWTGDDNAYTSSTSPMILTWRCGNGTQQYIAHSDNVTGTPYQTTAWVGNETKDIYFFGGNISSENWTGDFYWLYISPETLTDAEIQAVIDYNENL